MSSNLLTLPVKRSIARAAVLTGATTIELPDTNISPDTDATRLGSPNQSLGRIVSRSSKIALRLGGSEKKISASRL